MKKMLLAFLTCFFLSCASFYSKDDTDFFADIEAGAYTTLEDISVEQRFIAKNQPVKLIVKRDEESIKVYVYPASVDILKAERLLILYMFTDEFPKNKFSSDIFLQRLNRIVRKQ